ncbi:hypothetical protein VCHA54P496_350030 [Vibrio chagasii]|nr:hypothetical protein VCHA54P495_360001 [Vibrio chagasii]CAH7252336.1 hypothetical protein VCHA54P496_350030 [Vibrio chagasii]CAH7452760.1 hypothetical protein VCHA54P486_400031 [Vibrio chagasii]
MLSFYLQIKLKIVKTLYQSRLYISFCILFVSLSLNLNSITY